MNRKIFISNEKEKQIVVDKLIGFNRSRVPITQDNAFENFNFHIKDENGFVIAGINALMYCWGMVYIDALVVDENHHGKGLGSLLLAKVESEAKKMGASLSHLDTFDWQGKDFYLRAGYEIFGVLEDCPPGHQRYYMKKKL